MKFRWTIKNLKEFSDERILAALCTERLSELYPYTPLAERLKKIRTKLENQDEKRSGNRSV